MGTPQMAHNDKEVTNNDAPPLGSDADLAKNVAGKDNFERFIAAQPVLSGKEIPGIDMIPIYSLYRIGEIFDEGIASGYPKENWKKGVGDKAYQIARAKHAAKHLWKWLNGDRSEAHLAKVAWFCVTQLELERLEREKAQQ
jgi:hypothetical protein